MTCASSAHAAFQEVLTGVRRPSDCVPRFLLLQVVHVSRPLAFWRASRSGRTACQLDGLLAPACVTLDFLGQQVRVKRMLFQLAHDVDAPNQRNPP